MNFLLQGLPEAQGGHKSTAFTSLRDKKGKLVFSLKGTPPYIKKITVLFNSTSAQRVLCLPLVECCVAAQARWPDEPIILAKNGWGSIFISRVGHFQGWRHSTRFFKRKTWFPPIFAYKSRFSFTFFSVFGFSTSKKIEEIHNIPRFLAFSRGWSSRTQYSSIFRLKIRESWVFTQFFPDRLSTRDDLCSSTSIFSRSRSSSNPDFYWDWEVPLQFSSPMAGAWSVECHYITT